MQTMEPIYQKPFNTYGDSGPKELDSFPSDAIMDFLNTLPIEKTRRIDLFDRVFRFYMQ